MDPRVVLASGLGRLAWWRPRAASARDGGLAIERRRGVEIVPWAEVDAVIDLAPVLVQSRGRVLLRLPDSDDADAFVAIVVERAGLAWVERARKPKLPRMAVRPTVAASLRSGQNAAGVDRDETASASARMSAPGEPTDRGET